MSVRVSGLDEITGFSSAEIYEDGIVTVAGKILELDDGTEPPPRPPVRIVRLLVPDALGSLVEDVELLRAVASLTDDVLVEAGLLLDPDRPLPDEPLAFIAPAR